MIEIRMFKRFRYVIEGGMPKEKKKQTFNKTYLTLFSLHIAIPVKNNLKIK